MFMGITSYCNDIGRDWQTAMHATIIIEFNGEISINTLSTFLEFGWLKSRKSFIGCVIQSRYENKPLISKISTPIESEKKPDIIPEPFLSNGEE